MPPRHRYIRLILAVAFASLMLVACFRTPEPKASNRISYDLGGLDTQGSVSGNGVTINFDKVADWDAGSGTRGFTANVTIINATGATLSDWDLHLEFLPTITDMWNASYEQHAITFTITPASWNADIADGQSRSFGFNGIYAGVFQDPTSYVVSGIPVGDQSTPTPVATSCTLTSEFNVNSTWQNGDGSTGFVAEQKLTNAGADPVNWDLDFNLDAQISNMWNASYLQDPSDASHYTITPASWNTRIEPGQSITFGYQGTYTTTQLGKPSNLLCDGVEVEKPFDPYEGFNRETFDPNSLRTTREEFIQRYNEALADLSPVGHELLEEGRLFFNGLNFSPVPSVPSFSGVPGVTTQQVLSPDPQGPFECLLHEGDQILKKNGQGGIEYSQIGEPIYIPGKQDFGTFYHLGSRAGTDSEPVSAVSASFVLPATRGITNPGADQAPYVMITGRSPAIGPPAGDGTYGSNFDSGLGLDADGWYMFTNRFNPSQSGGLTARVYRLRNLDSAGAVVPEDINDQPYTVDVVTKIDEDEHLVFTVQPTGNTVWAEVNKGEGDTILRNASGAVSDATLGGDEQEQPNSGKEYLDPNAKFPKQTVEAFQADGVSNQVAIEIDMARDRWSPAAGTKVEGIIVLNAKINGRPFVPEYVTACPPGAYSVSMPAGDVAAATPEAGFKIDIDITEDDIHGCIDGAGVLSPKINGECGQGGGGSASDNDADGDGVSDEDERLAGTDPNDPNSVPEGESEPDGAMTSLGGRWSGNFGDPHIATPDRAARPYSFQAVGDYVLTRSTTPGDSFEVQIRYAPFTTENREWSGEAGVAMMVETDRVELYPVQGGTLAIYVNGQLIDWGAAAEQYSEGQYSTSILDLPGGGNITRREVPYDNLLSVNWPDGSILEADLTNPDVSLNVRGFTRVYFPGFRQGEVEGLLGNFDTDPDNDFRIRGGSTLDKPTEGELYTSGFRESWSVYQGAATSLFTQGQDPYDPGYPTQVVNLSDFGDTDLSAARQSCRDAGVVSVGFLRSCIFDVLVTGNPNWAGVAAGASRGLDAAVASITVNPMLATLPVNESVEIGAIASGPYGNLAWGASAGFISGSGAVVTYTAPAQPGVYTVTVQSTADATVSDVASVVVNAANRPPVAMPDYVQVTEPAPVEVLVLLNDSDPDGDFLSIVSIVQPVNGTATIVNGDGAFSDYLLVTPGPGVIMGDRITTQYTISDGRGGLATSFAEVHIDDSCGYGGCPAEARGNSGNLE